MEACPLATCTCIWTHDGHGMHVHYTITHSCQPPEFPCRDMLLYVCATPISLPTPTSTFSNKTKIMGMVEIWIVSLAALS